MLLSHRKIDPNVPLGDPPFIHAGLSASPSVFLQFMKRKDINLKIKLRNRTISGHLMRKYDEICGKEASKSMASDIMEEELRDKIMALCKNKLYDMNTHDGV